MAEYKVQGPDGKIIRMEGPDDATEEQILSFAEQHYYQKLLETGRPDYSFGEIASKSLARGYERFKSTYGDVLPAMAFSALGLDNLAEEQMQEAAESEALIQRTMPAQFPSFRDVDWANPIDISKFIIEATGEQAVNLAGVLVPGGVGVKLGERLATKEAIKRLGPKATDTAINKILKSPAAVKGRTIGQTSGVFLGSYALNAPEVFRNIYEETGSFEPGAAALAGVVNASLDSILPATILNQFSRPGRATIVSEILERSGMSPNLARKAVVQIFGSGVLEGITEATQEAVSITAENFVQDHSYLFDSKDFDRMLEGGVRGTFAGGTFRGVGVAAGKLRDKYFKTEVDKVDKKDKKDEGDDTPPTTTPPVKPLGEQLELDLEGGMAQGELDFDTGPVVGEQLELEGLGPKPTVGPLIPPVDPRQTELDFETQVAQIEEELVGPPTQQGDLFAPVASKPPTQPGLELEGGVSQPELTGLEPIPFRRTEEEQLDSAEPRLTEREVTMRANSLEYNIANAFVPNPSNIAELQELKDTYPEVFAERDFVSPQLGIERFEIPYEGGFKNVTKLSDTLLTNLPSSETERQRFGGSRMTGAGLYNTLAKNYGDKISEKKLSTVYNFMLPVIQDALSLGGTVSPDDILIEDANDIPVASVQGSIRKATPKQVEKLVAQKDELFRTKRISKELYNDPDFRIAEIDPERQAGASISKPKAPLVYFPAAYYMEQIASVDKKGADALIEAAISKAKNAGVRYLVAEDFTSTQALNAFRNRGFKDATKYLFKGEALDTPVDYGGDIKRKRGIIKKNLYLDIEADVKPKKPILPLKPVKGLYDIAEPKGNDTRVVPAGTTLYHGTQSDIDGIMSSRTLLARYEGLGKRNAGGILTEGGLVWFIENKDSAISFGGGKTKATVLSYTPKQNLNLLNRRANMSKKQADILNEIIMPRFGFSQAEINAVKKGGRYVKGNYPNNRLGDTDVIADKGRSFEDYVSDMYYRDYYSARVTNPYESGPPYELREAPDESGIIPEPVIQRTKLYDIWPLVLTPLGYDGFYYAGTQLALVGNKRIEFVQAPKVEKKVAKKKVAKKKVAETKVVKKNKQGIILDDKGQEKTFYHGTDKDFNEFKIGKSGAIFVSEDASLAAQFASPPLTTAPGEVVSGARIIPVKVNAKKLFDYRTQNHINRVVKLLSPEKTTLYGTIDGKPISDKQRFRMAAERGDYRAIEPFLDSIQEAGFDSFLVKEPQNNALNIGVFDPSQLESTITPTMPTPTTATPEISGIDSSLLNKEIEVTRQGKKQKGTYIEIDGSPFISYSYKGGTVKSAILPNDKVKEVKAKKEAAEEVPLKSIRKGKDSDKPIINRLKSKKTLGAVLNILKKANITRAQKLLVQVLLTVPNIGKTKFKMVDNLEFQNNAYGEYNRQQDTIQLSNNADVETVLHEAVHAATANLLNKHIRDGVGITRLGKQIIRLYEDAIAADTEGRFTTELSKVDEFIAESFTNPEFQKFLATNDSSFSGRLRGEDSSYEGSLRDQGVRPNVIRNIMNERRGINKFLSSIWSGFVSAVKDMIGISDTDFSYSILNDVISLAPQLFVGPNATEQAQTTQEILFKIKTDAIEENLDSGNMAPNYDRIPEVGKAIQKFAERIQRLPIANNKIGLRMTNALSNLPLGTAKLYLSFLSIPNKIELFAERIPALRDVLDFLQKKAADIKAGREEIEIVLRYVEGVRDKYAGTPEGQKTLKEWNEVLLELSGLDTNPETVLQTSDGLANLTKENPEAAALVRRYQKLPQDLKDAAYRIVNDLEQRYDRLLEAVVLANENISPEYAQQLREDYGKRPFYLPFVRKGDYWFRFTTKDGREGKSSAFSEAARNIEMERLIREEGATDVEKLSFEETQKLTQQPPAQFVRNMIEIIKNNENITPEQGQAIATQIEETYLDLFPDQSLRNNTRTRKVVPGYEKDIINAYASVAPRVVSSLANTENNYQLLNAINQVAYQANQPENRNNNLLQAVASDTINESPFLLNPIAKGYARLAAYGSYFWFLGFNVSSAIVNFTQVPLVVQPFLAGEYGGGPLGQQKAAEALGRASKLYFSGPGKKVGLQFEQTEGFLPDSTAAPFKVDIKTGDKTFIGPNAELFALKGQRYQIKETDKVKIAEKDGKFAELFNKAEEAAALRRGVGYEITELSKDLSSPIQTGGSRIVSKIEKAVGYIFQNSERLNRELTLLAAFDLEMQKSGNKDLAIQKAIDLTSKVHSHALPEVGPRLFQDGIGKVAFVFKRFAQAQIYLISKLFFDIFGKSIPKNLSKEEQNRIRFEKQMAKKQLLGVLGYTFLMAGAQGLPLYGAFALAAHLMFDDDDDPFSFDTFVNQKIGDIAFRGPLSYIIGADISRRTGFRDLVFREDAARLEEIGFPLYAMETVLGPAYAVVKRAFEAPEFFERGQQLRAYERTMPTAISNVIKTFRQSMEGVRNKNGVKIVEDDPSLYESFMQIVGFTNIEVSEAYQRANALKRPERQLLNRRTSLLLRYWLASQEGDNDAVKEIMEEIQEFNKKAPGKLAITPSTIVRSMKARQKRTRDSTFGINLPRTYKQDLMDIYDIDEGDLDIFD